MGIPPRGVKSFAANRPKTEARSNIIQAVTNPLGFFVLVILIVEAILGMLAGVSGSENRTEYVRIMAAIIVMLVAVVSVLAWFRPEALMGAGSSARETEGIRASSAVTKIFERSNDFLSTGNKYQFPSLLKQVTNEAWFIGTSFFISLDQYNDLILERLADGININFLILDPYAETINKVAGLMDVTPKEVFHDCMSGIRILDRTVREAAKRELHGELRVKITAEPIQTRVYMFDPRADTGYFYFVPHLNGTNPQTVPGFLAANAKAPICESYFKGVLKIWADPAIKSLADWQSLRPDPT
jgi:hypothetical protein